jgi:hypothetical protein
MTAWKVDKAVGNVKKVSRQLFEPASVAPEQQDVPPLSAQEFLFS